MAPDQKKRLKEFHDTIMEEDGNVQPEIGVLMGKEALIYKQNGEFKYALAGLKNYFTLHVMPMYANPEIRDTYRTALRNVKFQKGCVNFKDFKDFPREILRELIKDSRDLELPPPGVKKT